MGQAADYVEVRFHVEREPEAHLRALVQAIDQEADWEIEGAHVAWRARRQVGGMTWEVGIGRMGPDEPWLVAWRVDPEIPEVLAFGALITALVVAGGLGAAGMALDGGLWPLIAALVGLVATLRIAKVVVQWRLPPTEGEARALGQRVRAALAALPDAKEAG